MEPSAPRAATASGGIFLSYRRQDTAYAAGWLFERLAEHYGRDQVFKDVDSLQLGDDFVARIHAAVGSCSALLALIGEEWLTVVDEQGRRRIDDPNDFVLVEVEAGLARGVLVIPILVDGARMPHPTEVPVSLEPLVRRQALELNPARFDFDVSQLRAVLDRTLHYRGAVAGPERSPDDSAEPVSPGASGPRVHQTPSPDGKRSAGSRALSGRTAVAVLALLVFATVVALGGFALLRPDTTTSARGSTERSTSRSSGASETSSTTSSTPATRFIVENQGRTELADPIQGLDLTSGQHVLAFQSHLAWLADRLSVFDETTLGARVLGDTTFAAVTPARLATTRYGRGAANPPLSPSELPVGRVLAVHVADRTYAKLAVVRYGPGDTVELRWVTYRAA